MQNIDDDDYSEGTDDFATVTKNDNDGAEFDSDIINSIVKDAPEGFEKGSDYLTVAKITSETASSNVFELKYNRKLFALSLAEDGSATLSPEAGQVRYGKTVTVTPSHASDKEVDTVKYGETEVTAEDSVYKFTMPASDTEVSVTFKDASID